MNIDKYLYEIIEDYKDAKTIEEKDEIFNSFCSSIWSNRNKRRTYTKIIRFKVRDDLLNSEIGQIFNVWSVVEYVGYKAMTNDVDWCSLIRQKINNLYTKYFDDQVILNKDYINLLKTPYNLYYRWIKGAELNANELTNNIEDAVYKATELKSVYQHQKINMSWNEYKKIVEKYLKKIFDNCKPIEYYETENLTNKYIYEFSSEDNSYVSCFCKSLDGYMLNYQKEYYGLKRGRNKQYKRCIKCGKLIEKTNNRVKYCKECYKKINEADAPNRMKRHREKHKKYEKNCVTF